MSTEFKSPPPSRKERAIYRLTDAEIEEMREGFRKSSEWARRQLAIDPELKHLGPSERKPGTTPRE